MKDFEIVRKNSSSSDPIQVVDARGSQRYNVGHIPQSFSVPFPILLKDDRTLRSPEEITEIFKSKNVKLDEDIVSTCGSGITAAILAHALYYSTGKEIPIYDGSWSEWKVRAPHKIAHVEVQKD